MTDTQQKALYGMELVGIGAYAPERIITNDELTNLVDTSDEWITTRTGIRQRHVVSGDETVTELSIKAANEALACANMKGEEIDCLPTRSRAEVV